MHKFHYKLLFIIFCLSGSYGYAQILSPNFICVKNDTIIWSPANNSCGPFESYDIYFAPNFGGPYSLLTNVTDPTETKYHHPNPTDLTRYYYLESNHDCPSELAMKSDTLDNQAPSIIRITSLKTIGNSVEINWLKSTSPEVDAYIIYREFESGAIPIDTVFDDVTYLDLTADPLNKDEAYYVLALDPCGNTSLFGAPQVTYQLDYELSECVEEIIISWIPTSNFGVATQEIWLSVEGTNPVMVGSVGGAENEYTISNVEVGLEHCIFVRAVAARSGFEAVTNTICTTPPIIALKDLYYKNIDVQFDGNVKVDWVWSENAAFQSASILVNGIGSNSKEEIPIDLTPPLSKNNTYFFSKNSVENSQFEFQINTIDDCNALKSSGFGSPIFLSIGSDGGLNNTCLWTPLRIPGVSVQKYEIYRSMNGRSEVVGEVDFFMSGFTDNLSVNDVTNGEMCYYIRATSILTHPDGTEEEIFSKSNQICKTVSAKIFMPNAFAPRGRNQILKPIVSFGSPQEFKMLVYNRYGSLVFESNNIQNGWNGRYEGKVASAGVYSYQIRMIQQDGSAEQMSGFVMLVQ